MASVSPPVASLQGKRVLVTGASAGIGKVTALELARLGAEVVLVCRDAARGEATRAEVQAKGGGAPAGLLLGDLSSQASIRKLAAEVQARYSRLDVLVNNAGAMRMERDNTVDGLERTFATNHLGYFLFTNLLLDLLRRSAPARIVNVSSGAHSRGRLDFDDLNSVKRYRGFQAYCDSKLANIYFTYELARRLEGSGVTVNCLHPGAVATNFGQGDGTGWFGFAIKLARPFFLSAEAGARTTIYLASSPEVEGVSGKYFVKCAARHSSRLSQDPAIAARLWEVSEKLTASA